jgi:multidrug efflux pump subunit AcrA (membrane-fusion protein)
VEYRQIIEAAERQFIDEEADLEARQTELDSAQALLDRRRKALKRKRVGFERMMRNFRDLDVEVISGKPSRSDAGDDVDPDERPEPAGGEAVA